MSTNKIVVTVHLSAALKFLPSHKKLFFEWHEIVVVSKDITSSHHYHFIFLFTTEFSHAFISKVKFSTTFCVKLTVLIIYEFTAYFQDVNVFSAHFHHVLMLVINSLSLYFAQLLVLITVYAVARFFHFFDQLRRLRMWKMQLLDEHHLFIKYTSEDVVTLRVTDPSQVKLRTHTHLNSSPSSLCCYCLPPLFAL